MSAVRRGAEALLWLAAAVAMLRYGGDLIEVLRTPLPLYDFSAYLSAAQHAVDGSDIYVAPDFRYRYPPTLALLLTPLTVLSPLTAQRLWTLLDQGLLAAAMWLALRLLSRRPRRIEIAVLLVAGFGFFPLYTQVKLGQLGNLLFLLIAAMATLWHRGARLSAAWPIALAGTLKLYPLGFALWFARQNGWRTAVAVVVLCAAILVLPGVIFRAGWLADFVRALSDMFAVGASPTKADNQSFYAFIARLDGVSGASPRFLSLGFAVAAALALGAFVVTLACTPDRRLRGDELAIAVVAAVLPLGWANPANWSHNHVVLLLAAPALVQRLADRLGSLTWQRRDVAAAAAAVGAWVCLSQPYRLPRLLGHGELHTDPLSMLLRSTFLFGAIVLWIVLLRELRLAAQAERSAAV